MLKYIKSIKQKRSFQKVIKNDIDKIIDIKTEDINYFILNLLKNRITMTINPYLIFNGTCEEAFLFYQSVFGGEIPYMGKFKDMPSDGESKLSEKDANKIMHVSLPIGNGTIIMGSDSNTASGDVKIGDNVSISIDTDSSEEADKLFNGLSAGGNIKMPPQKTFWGAYFSMFEDKFGIHWMINFDEKK